MKKQLVGLLYGKAFKVTGTHGNAYDKAFDVPRP